MTGFVALTVNDMIVGPVARAGHVGAEAGRELRQRLMSGHRVRAGVEDAVLGKRARPSLRVTVVNGVVIASGKLQNFESVGCVQGHAEIPFGESEC